MPALARLAIRLRSLTRRPKSTVLVILLLGLGIGMPTAMFSVLDGVLLRGLPFPDGDRLVTVTTGPAHDWPMPTEDFLDLRAQQRSLQDVAAFRTFNTVLTRSTAGSRGFTATYVTGNLFRLLGVEPVLGRGFEPADEAPSAPAVAILSHALWVSQFGADPEALGEEVILNREPMTVIGVMPEGFHFPIRQQAWAAIRWHGRPWSLQPTFVVGKLRPRSSPRQAEMELASFAAGLDRARPAQEARQVHVRKYADSLLPSTVHQSLKILLWSVCGVLLIACANAANLRLVEGHRRGRELSIRRAVGAGNRQILGLLLGESAILALAGTVLGVGLAAVLVRLSSYFLQGSALVRYFWIDIRLDFRSLGFAVALAGLALLAGGLLPALVSLGKKSLRAPGNPTPGEGSLRLTKSLIACQVAICFALVTGSAFLLESGLGLLHRQPGLAGDGLLRSMITVYQADLESPRERGDFWSRLFEELGGDPQIDRATMASAIPWRAASGSPIRLDPGDPGDPESLPKAKVLRVYPGFFEALGLLPQRGRLFTTLDIPLTNDPDIPPQMLPAVASRSFVERHFPTVGDPSSALGSFLEILPKRGSGEPQRVRLIGVVADMDIDRLDEPFAEDRLFLPFDPARQGGGFLLTRSRGVESEAIERIDAALTAVNPLVARLDSRSFQAEQAEQIWAETRLAELFGVFAATALALSAAGLYGVITFSLQRRRRELAIRAALGARPADLHHLLLGEAGRCIAAGLALGSVGVALTLQAVSRFLYRVEPWDPTLLLSSALFVALLLLLSTLGPARQASRSDPATTLATE